MIKMALKFIGIFIGLPIAVIVFLGYVEWICEVMATWK
jgi:hypothetical protein